MKGLITKILLSKGAKLCAVAVTLASVAPLCCRGNWYQPNEPDGLEDFFTEQVKKS